MFQQGIRPENDIILFAPFGLDYIREKGEQHDGRLFEERNHSRRDTERKVRRQKGKKETGNIQHKEIAIGNIWRPDKTNLSRKRRKVANKKNRKKKKKTDRSGKNGRFSPSSLSTIYPAAHQLKIGHLSIRSPTVFFLFKRKTQLCYKLTSGRGRGTGVMALWSKTLRVKRFPLRLSKLKI